jgi:hypothetical protein
MEQQPFARQMEAEMIHEIESHPPEFIVCASYFTSWMENASPSPPNFLLVERLSNQLHAGRTRGCCFTS